MRLRLGFVAVLFTLFGAWAAPAQPVVPSQTPVLVIETDRLYVESAFGKQILADLARASEALTAENRQIEADLEAEELALTEQRSQLDAAAFRKLADAFDVKVRGIRQDQLTKARDLRRLEEEIAPEFLASVGPILEEMMAEYGALVILERRSVFVSLNAIDITNAARIRIDAAIGDGSGSRAVDDLPSDP